MGAVLSEKKRAIVSYPGGCDIGLRPIDIHIKALRELGVMIEEKSGLIYCDASGIRSGEVYLDYPSVGATENVILATVNLKGTTIIHNAAREPEIIDLQNFINKMGGKVSGAGTTTVIVSGISKLKGVNFSVMSDRIATGTYLLALLICGGEIALESADKADVNSILSKLPKNCCQISYNNDIIYIKSDKRIKSVECISTQPYPGFPTDLQAPFTSLECISEGTCVLTENIFENRFRHVPELRKMGADIIIKDKTAIIKGVKNLTGAETYARDLRGGAALVLAGLAAKGKTVVHDVYHIDRGYDKMDKVLKNLGADIVRE